jgi:hypothetical protein
VSGVVFGDLAGIADEHLDVAARFDGRLDRGPVVAAADAASWIARVLSAYLADVANVSVVEAITSADLDERTRAVVGARTAVQMAAVSLRDSVGAAGRLNMEEQGPVAVHLEAAAMALTAGRDLLQTHFLTDPEGLPVERSDWAAVITSTLVAGALRQKVGSWSRQLAYSVAGLSLSASRGAAVSAAVQKGLADGCHCLLTASAVLDAEQRSRPAVATDARVLEAVPVNVIMPRQPPQEGEPIRTLAAGVVRGAARLRMIAWVTEGHAAWSPAITADSWRWTAATTAVVFHAGGLILKSLAGHPGLGGALPAVGPQLRAAADSASRAWNTWRATAASWGQISTETKGLTAPAIDDSGDLVVRFGRLAFHDPAWTPARRKSAAPRHAVRLAPDAAQFTVIIDAIHRGIDALARVAACDQRAINLAIRAGRVQMPFRTHSEHGGPFRFGHITPSAAAALLDDYAAAVRSAGVAVAKLDVLATEVGTPSQVLAAARQAGRPLAVTGHGQTIGPEISAGTMVGDLLTLRRPGELERTVRHLCAADPVLHLRARAIEAAAHALVAEAKDAARHHREDGHVPDLAPTPPPGSQAKIASVSFPENGASSVRPQETTTTASLVSSPTATYIRSPRP